VQQKEVIRQDCEGQDFLYTQRQVPMADLPTSELVTDALTSALVQVWLRNIQNLLTRGLGDAASKVLERALKSLPQRKHIKVSQINCWGFGFCPIVFFPILRADSKTCRKCRFQLRF
jgi:hypothetical protein